MLSINLVIANNVDIPIPQNVHESKSFTHPSSRDSLKNQQTY